MFVFGREKAPGWLEKREMAQLEHAYVFFDIYVYAYVNI